MGPRHPDARELTNYSDFLKSHGLDALPHPVDSGRPPADALLEVIRLYAPACW
jgi:hypothetical protein